MNAAEGKKAVQLARQAVELWVRDGKRLQTRDYPQSFEKRTGVFVTLHTYPKKDLRGCIGFPEAAYHLIHGIIEASIFACRDPRFPPVVPEELDHIIVEVSVLTPPMPMKGPPEERLKKVRKGKDGLIIIRGPHSGLLLPQVATEHKMSVEEFLQCACTKAFLPPDSWKDKETQVFTFQCNVFSEKKPGVV